MIKKILLIIFKNINNNFYKKNFFTKIIYFVSSFQSSFKLIYHNYCLIFKTEIDYDKLKLIFSLPRSGRHYIDYIFDSYLEQLYGFGNGEPKVKGNKILPEEKSLMYGLETDLKDNLITKIKFLNYEFTKIKRPSVLNEIDYNVIYGDHHPIQYVNLIDFNKLRAVILYRDPLKATSSMTLFYFFHRMRDKEINLNNINEFKHTIYNRCDLIIRFINYWNNLSKKKPENFLFIQYDDLINNTYNVLVKILEFYKIQLNKDYLLKSINVNSKKNLEKIGFKDFKVITPSNQFELRNHIEAIIKEYFRNKKFDYRKVFEN